MNVGEGGGGWGRAWEYVCMGAVVMSIEIQYEMHLLCLEHIQGALISYPQEIHVNGLINGTQCRILALKKSDKCFGCAVVSVTVHSMGEARVAARPSPLVNKKLYHVGGGYFSPYGGLVRRCPCSTRVSDSDHNK